jgi:Fe-S-cluster-containing hydrogenase component 2/bacterioferritin-associated ferredoxin
MLKGRVAVVECVQEIPCNPCESACPFGAIAVGDDITSLPALDGDKCTGCGSCVPGCPGLAIFIVDKSRSDGMAEIAFPYEYLPLPTEGDTVTAADRAGQGVCSAKVLEVKRNQNFNGTVVVTIMVPIEFADEARGILRGNNQTGGDPSVNVGDPDDDLIVCRCREVTKREILDAIDDGATTVDGVKRRTSACMGLCQGKTCERIVIGLIAEYTGQDAAKIFPQKSRMPVRPVRISDFGGKAG